MIGVRFNRANFDLNKGILADKTASAVERNLVRNGLMLRRTMQQLMRYRKKPSKPGQPPSAHKVDAKHPRGPLLKKMLFSDFDRATKSVVAGPEGFGTGNVPSMVDGGSVIRIRRPMVSRRTGKPMSPKQKMAFERKKKAGTLPPRSRVMETVSVRVAPRPFRDPALKKEGPKLKGVWANTVK